MHMEIITAEKLTFSYDNTRPALDNVSFSVNCGEFVSVLGGSGSGKTTLARMLNALLPLQQGKLQISGFDARDKNRLWQIRKCCGMIFQNPDDQFVCTYVADDVAFAARNFGIEEDKLPKLVREALNELGIGRYAERSPQLLSQSQKLKVAFAGVLAAQPDVLLLDDICAALDPQSRHEILRTIKKLHAGGKTILMFTQNVEEAALAERVIILHDGRILADGSPHELLSDTALLDEAGLEPPFPVKIYYDLLAAGAAPDSCPLTVEELVDEVCR